MAIRVSIKKPKAGIELKMPKNRKNTLRVSGLIRISKFAAKGDKADAVVDPVLREIEKAFDQASAIMVSRLGDALDAAMSSTAWPSGKDIIDTGKLISSRRITYKNGSIDIAYNVPYFGIVHFGGYIHPYGNKNAEKIYIPGRPWITYTVEGGGPVPQFDFEGLYEEALGQLL